MATTSNFLPLSGGNWTLLQTHYLLKSSSTSSPSTGTLLSYLNTSLRKSNNIFCISQSLVILQQTSWFVVFPQMELTRFPLDTNFFFNNNKVFLISVPPLLVICAKNWGSSKCLQSIFSSLGSFYITVFLHQVFYRDTTSMFCIPANFVKPMMNLSTTYSSHVPSHRKFGLDPISSYAQVI